MRIQRPAVFIERDALLVEVGAAGAGSAVPRRHAGRLVGGVRSLGYLAVSLAHEPGVSAFEGHRRQQALRRDLAVAGHALDDALACRHPEPADGETGCSCRPPAVGLLVQAAATYGIDLRRSVVLAADARWTSAARRAGVRGVLVGERRDPTPAADGWAPNAMAALAGIARVRTAELEHGG